MSFAGRLVLIGFLAIGLVGCPKKSSSDGLSSALGPPNSAYAFAIDHGGNVFVCVMDGITGGMSSCAVTNGGATFTEPYGFALSQVSQYAYVTDLAANNVYVCAVNGSTAQLSGCTVSNGGVSGWMPMGITAIMLNGSQFVYVIDSRGGTGNVYVCSANSSTSALTSCSISNGGVSWVDPSRIAFAGFNGAIYAYVTDYGAHNFYQCTVDPTTGALSSCTVSNGGEAGWNPGGIIMGSFDGSTFYAYVTDNAHGNIYLCGINTLTGGLSSCAVSNGGASGWAPSGITMSYENGFSYADISDQNGNIYVCSVNTSTGALSACAVSNGGVTFSGPHWPDFIYSIY